jgi:hypothetical protein
VTLGDPGILFQHLPGTDEEKNRQYSEGDFLLPKVGPWTLRLRRMNVVEKRREKQVVAACPYSTVTATEFNLNFIRHMNCTYLFCHFRP